MAYVFISGCTDTETTIDLVFVIDGSGSICDDNPALGDGKGCNNWVEVVNFVVEFVKAVSPSESGTHVGLLSFAREPIFLTGLNRSVSFTFGL